MYYPGRSTHLKYPQKHRGKIWEQLPLNYRAGLYNSLFYLRCCQKTSLGFKHFICFTVKSQFPLGDKVNQGKVNKFRASSPCRQQIYSQHSSNVVYGGFKPWPYPGNPEVKEYFLPVFKGVYFQASSFGKCLIWQAKISCCSAKSRK